MYEMKAETEAMYLIKDTSRHLYIYICQSIELCSSPWNFGKFNIPPPLAGMEASRGHGT